MFLQWEHPQVAWRDCGHCAQYVYDEKTGQPRKWNGELYPRPPGTFPPCRQCPKKGPHKGLALTPENRQAIEHYRECAAIGQFPDDPIVRRTAALIHELESRYRHNQMMQALQALIR